ncbi:MAG: beta-lactamase family protein [Prevotellaceae bacterium]|nr:beta-lactamase family protein [Prevotellaceae bacterium]
MRKLNLHLLVLLVAGVFTITPCKPKVNSNNEKLIETIKKLAADANIPHIQLEFGDGENVISFESSQVDSIPALEDGTTIFQTASLSKPIFGYIVMRMVDKGEIDLGYTHISIYRYR